MARLRVHNLAMSIDGYVAGTGQDVEHPLGVGGEALHTWMFETRTWKRMVGEPGGTTDVDETFMAAGDTGVGATIMGRNMFGPVRGPWPDESWRGWWGEEPPYRHDVFVLTHYPRASLEVGETTFHFVQDEIEHVLARAVEAAGGLDVRLGGGASTVRQYLAAGLVDHLHVPISPVIVGAGERLFADGLDLAASGYELTEVTASPTGVTHTVFGRTQVAS